MTVAEGHPGVPFQFPVATSPILGWIARRLSWAIDVFCSPSVAWGPSHMKRIILLIVSPIALLLGLWQMWSGLVEIFPSIRQDHQISAAAADAGKAASDLNSLAKDAFETGRPPRQTDPGVKSLLDRVFGTDVLARRTVGESDLGATADWSMAVVKAGAVYILAGTGIADFSKMTNDPKLPERINQNVVAFAPEMGRYFDAQLAVMGGML